jgi:hypothetical protein
VSARVYPASPERLSRAAATRHGVPLLIVTIPLGGPVTGELRFDTERDKRQLLQSLNWQPEIRRALKRLGLRLEAAS